MAGPRPDDFVKSAICLPLFATLFKLRAAPSTAEKSFIISEAYIKSRDASGVVS
jgi:hypothetical protein